MQGSDGKRLMLEGRTSEDRLQTNAGLKLSNKKSVFSEKREIRERFHEAVDAAQEKHHDGVHRALELGQKFNKIFNDKTLPDNKGPMVKSLEKEVLREWQNYIMEMNNPPDDDLTTPEGAGSLGGLLMAFSALLKLRDRANTAEYRVQELEKEIKTLKLAMTQSEASSRE
jgi:hypothetical protein